MSKKHRKKKGRARAGSKAVSVQSPSHRSKQVQRHNLSDRTRAEQGRKAERQRLTRRKIWLFRIAALVIGPILFLFLTELVLRIAGYGFDPHPTIRCKVAGQSYRGDNVKFGWRFFTPILSREFEPFAFPARKPADTCRIFVLGASAAQGIPNPAFCFGRFLKVMLQKRFPEVHFEVITAAMAAINSHVVVEIAKDCARYEPDLFVVYLGNNEVIGPFGPGTVLTPVLSNLQLIRLSIALGTTKTGQLLSNLFGRYKSHQGNLLQWQGMAMFLGQQVRSDDPRLQTTYEYFRRNLDDICQIGAKSGAETIVCTVGSNLRDCPPFASLHRSDLTSEQQASWDEAYKQGVDRESVGQNAEAIVSYRRAAEIDDSHAELQYRLGRCYWLEGEYENARAYYIRARDLDTLRFRADTYINDIIRTIGDGMKSQGVHLADAAMALNANSPHGLAGKEYFYEHVHMTFAGNYVVAQTICGQAEPLIAGQFVDKTRSGGTIPTQEQCAKRLAYNDWSRHETLYSIVHSFMQKPPFTNQAYHDNQVRELTQQLQTMQTALTPKVLQEIGEEYLAAIKAAPDDWQLRWDYAKLLAEDLKQYDASIEQFRVIQQFVPNTYIVHDALASVLRGKGAIDSAIVEYRKVLAIKPTSGSAYYYLGWCYRKQGKTEAAMEQYRKATRFEPTCIPAYIDWGELLFRQGKLAEAVEVCQRGVAMAPNHARLHSNLGMLLIRTGKRREGEEEILKAFQLDPNSPQIRKVVESLLGTEAIH